MTVSFRSLQSRFSASSLSVRVITLSTVLAILALMLIAAVISTLYRDAAERNFDSLLSAHLFNLIASVGVSDSNELEGSPELGDLRYTVPGSGWYWEVAPVAGGISGIVRSQSLTQPLPGPTVDAVPFDEGFRRAYRMEGLSGEEVLVMESEFALGPQNGAARFRIMGNWSQLESDIASFSRQLYFYLFLFGLAMIVVNAMAIRIGLRPLDRVRRELAHIRDGRANRLDGRFPREIQPLVNELNALIETNRNIVERARTQVGNLAHSLKTPLSVLSNEAAALGGKRGSLLTAQAGAMRTQIDHYLQRARMAAQRNSLRHRTDAADALGRVSRVMEKLHRNVNFTLRLPQQPLIVICEKEDFEEIVGNILENAGKWANARVDVEAAPVREDDTRPMVRITVDDDGPGIPPEQAREALERGRRLDEATPGTGLGLSIVSDLVGEYGGNLELAKSPLGGLRVIMELRSVT